MCSSPGLALALMRLHGGSPTRYAIRLHDNLLIEYISTRLNPHVSFERELSSCFPSAKQFIRPDSHRKKRPALCSGLDAGSRLHTDTRISLVNCAQYMIKETVRLIHASLFILIYQLVQISLAQNTIITNKNTCNADGCHASSHEKRQSPARPPARPPPYSPAIATPAGIQSNRSSR
jgi:hypothetical protein